MEDSYTVHRRRKAAARKREKTPEPPKRRQDDVADTDDEEDARARMERMVQETEMLEELEEKERRKMENEKIASENNEKSGLLEEKPQRVLKRAISPEIRRHNDEIHKDVKKNDTKLSMDAGKREKIEKSEKEERGFETRKTSDIVNAPPEMENQTKHHVEETTRRLKKDDKDTAVVPRNGGKNRRDSGKDFSPENLEKLTNSGKKVSSPDNIERSEKNRSDNETKRSEEFTRDLDGSGVSRKTSSRTDDETEQTTTRDENRRETKAELARSSSGKNLKNESTKHEDLRRNEETKISENRENLERSSGPDEEKVRKREVRSPGKTRNSESRASTTTSSKRSSKERNNEKIGYTTDSSETEENAKRRLRRKKSPEEAKLRSAIGKKNSSRSRPTTDTDGDPDEQEHRKKHEKKSSSRRRYSSETDDDTTLKNRTRSPSHREKRDLPRVSSRQADKMRTGEKKWTRHTSDVNDDDSMTMTKSETFPPDKVARDKPPSIVRSTSEIKKQIIPLNDDSLIEDFEKAQRDYMRKERSILDYDPMDDYIDPRMEAALRRRKLSIIQTEMETTEVAQLVQHEKKSWFGWLPFFGKTANKEKLDDDKDTKMKTKDKIPSDDEEISSKKNIIEKLEDNKTIIKDDTKIRKKIVFVEFFRAFADFRSEFRAFIEQNPRETRKIRILRNRCLAELLLAIIYCGLGAFIFRFTEGAFETFYKCGVKRVKRDFLDSLWNFSHNLREEDWKSMARRKLMEFEEQLHTAHEAGVHSYSGQKSWSFLNAVVYCLTVITTIGYGHISPSTTTGRAITIVYAIFGIPMFLIILADFGKLFTRGIKFLWAFVRRVYYTGSCRKVRRTVPVQEVMKGVQLVYDLATFRRPSQMNSEEIEEMEKQQNQTQTVLNLDGNAPSSAQPDTPGTPALSTFAIDDEFNLPISVAIIILLAYIFVGATVYNFWEQWGFFESFYFVFISMSTIGFGDYVPKHPIYMMLSIVYLVFGLALTSMCINVVQVMLSDSFKQASQKIGATIGFEVTEEDGSVHPAAPPNVEIADVHQTIKESESNEQVAPKAKQEDVEL